MEADAARIRREIEADRRTTSPFRLKDDSITVATQNGLAPSSNTRSAVMPTSVRPLNTSANARPLTMPVSRVGLSTPTKQLKPKTYKVRVSYHTNQ